MHSYYVEYQELSEETHEIYNLFGAYPTNINERLDFYLSWLYDVVPHGVTVYHVSTTSPLTHLMTSERVEIAEIQLRTDRGEIFMTGLVSMEENAIDDLEMRAATEAIAKLRAGHFVDETWRFFSGLTQVRFCNGYVGDDEKWERVGEWDPIRHADEVAEYLQQEYDQLGAVPI